MPETGSSATSRAVLITGCSSGIGRATAERLARRGWAVYATARDVEEISPIADCGCRLLPLDVTDEDSMRDAVEEVERIEGAEGGLINNAGYSQSGVSAGPARSPSEAPVEVFSRHYDRYLENYEGYVKLAERIYRMQGGAKVPSGFGAEPQWGEEKLRRVEDRIQRTTARLDILERSTTPSWRPATASLAAPASPAATRS